MKRIILSLLLIGCTTVPNRYNEYVIITNGIYKGQSGVLIGDCSGIENYKVRLIKENKNICVRIWNLQKEF